MLFYILPYVWDVVDVFMVNSTDFVDVRNFTDFFGTPCIRSRFWRFMVWNASACGYWFTFVNIISKCSEYYWTWHRKFKIFSSWIFWNISRPFFLQNFVYHINLRILKTFYQSNVPKLSIFAWNSGGQTGWPRTENLIILTRMPNIY